MLGLSRTACVVGVVCVALVTSNASGFLSYNELWAGPNMEGWKWGDPLRGTGAVITWGFMTNDTVAGADFKINLAEEGSGILGTSDIPALRATVDGTYGAGAFDQAIQNAFDTWSKVANISFVGPLPDTGLPINDPGANEPMIRIGAFTADPAHSFNDGFAVGFIPPPNGGTLEGDIIFNIDKALQIAPGTEDVTPVNFVLGNDMEGLFLHELGHAAIGLGHPDWDGEDPDQRVMYVGDFVTPGAPFCCESLNRQLHADDIAGAVFNYGPPGDYDNDGAPDADDIDALFAERNAGTHDPYYEQTFDGLVNDDDAAFWVTDASIAHTFFGDANLDKTVSLADLDALGTHFGLSGGWAHGDFSGDGLIGLVDLDFIGANFGQSNATPSNVPEPGALSLLALGAMTIVRRSS